MDAQLVEFQEVTTATNVAEFLEGLAQDLRAGKVRVDAGGASADFDVKGELELEVEAEYNSKKNKYSLEVSIDWRGTEV